MRSLVFPIQLFSSISSHWSLKKAFLSLLAILWNSAFRSLYLSISPLLFASLLFSAISKASPDSHFAFLHFFSMGMVLILSPVQCHEPLSIVHQVLSIKSISHFHCIIIRDLIWSYLNGLVVFPTFFKSEFDNKELMIWARVPHGKRQVGRSTSWNQDCREKYQ